MLERMSVRRGEDDRRAGSAERREQNRRTAESRPAGGTADEEHRMAPRRTHEIQGVADRRDGERRAEGERRMPAFV